MLPQSSTSSPRFGEVAVNKSLGRRIADCRALLQVRTNVRTSQRDFGVLVARKLGLPKALTKMTVSRWESGTSEPGLTTLSCIAELTGVDPGWLAFGKQSRAPVPFAGLGGPRGDLAREVEHALQSEDIEQWQKWLRRKERENLRFADGRLKAIQKLPSGERAAAIEALGDELRRRRDEQTQGGW